MTHIPTESEKLFNQLKSEHYLEGLNGSQMPEKLAWYLSEINAIHPFREGNGRTQRLFIELLAQRNGYEVDFSDISSDEMIVATAESFMCRYEKLYQMFHKIVKPLTEQ